MKSQTVLFRDFLSKYRFEGVSFHFRMQVCLKRQGSLEKTLFIFFFSSGSLDMPALNCWQRISFSVWSFSNPSCVYQLPCLYFGVVFSKWRLFICRKEQVKQMTSLLNISFLSRCKVLRTNLKTCFKSLKSGREHICCISSTSKHAGGLISSSFLSFSLLLAY